MHESDKWPGPEPGLWQSYKMLGLLQGTRSACQPVWDYQPFVSSQIVWPNCVAVGLFGLNFNLLKIEICFLSAVVVR